MAPSILMTQTFSAARAPEAHRKSQAARIAPQRFISTPEYHTPLPAQNKSAQELDGIVRLAGGVAHLEVQMWRDGHPIARTGAARRLAHCPNPLPHYAYRITFNN